MELEACGAWKCVSNRSPCTSEAGRSQRKSMQRTNLKDILYGSSLHSSL